MRGTVMAVGAVALAGVLTACSSGAANDATLVTSAATTPTGTSATTATAATTGTTTSATTATAAATPTTTVTSATGAEPLNGPEGTQRLHFEYGPIAIAPGQNAIQFSNGQVPKPAEDGWILRIAPNLRYADGSVPPVDVVHLHHGVWLNTSHSDITIPTVPERFFAVGEEKTITSFPPGYGYHYAASDQWVLNYMIHDLTPKGTQVWITYDLDFLPAAAPAANSIQPVRPVWMDIQNGSVYPVFDVLQGSGSEGTFTYPDQAADPYGDRPPANVWTSDRDGILVGTGGHLHPGGLYDDLWLQRSGQTAHLFRSEAHYFEPAGAVSWDVATTVTKPDWRVAVHRGESLRVTTTYDSDRASWYESMGIMVAWMAEASAAGDAAPADPFTTAVDAPGVLTHGHLPENDNHGGTGAVFADPSTRASTPAAGPIGISGFVYGGGDMSFTDPLPTVTAGQTLTFRNDDAPIGPGIWHSITSCRAPCNAATGIAYPLADGAVAFDSGQLGTAGPPTAGRIDWHTPANLPPGLYTYFCRIHPFMRGAFEVAAP